MNLLFGLKQKDFLENFLLKIKLIITDFSINYGYENVAAYPLYYYESIKIAWNKGKFNTIYFEKQEFVFAKRFEKWSVN